MPTMFVAKSDSQQGWASDVGLTRHVYKLGLSADGAEAAVDAFNAESHAGRSDWTLLAAQETAETDEEALFRRVARKETMVDPTYYPQLKRARGIFKVKLANVENHLLVKEALEGHPPRKTKAPTAAQIAAYLLRLAAG